MLQSLNVHAEEINKIPEHTAQAAAAGHNKSDMTAHEETVQAEEQARDAGHLADKLHHGKEAAIEAAKAKR